MSPLHFYREQAARQQAAADSATLRNVRERCQRASDAWAALALRGEAADRARSHAATDTRLDRSSDRADRAAPVPRPSGDHA